MATATNKATGVSVTADDAVIARLGPEWEPARKAPLTPRRRTKKKTDDE